MASPHTPPRGTREYDVVVVGSGGAGLIAACAAADQGAHVAVIERSPLLGGTTAISGGQLWIPNHHHLAALGIKDSRADALRYLDRIVLDATADDVVEAFVDNAPALAAYLEQNLGIRLFAVVRPDYHPDFPGACHARTLEPLPLHAGRLGRTLHALRTSGTRPPVTSQEGRTGLSENILHERRQDNTFTQGTALVAGLLQAALDRNVDVHTETQVCELLEENGRVNGVRALGTHGRILLRAHRSVVLASGGFEWNDQMRADFLPPVASVPVSPPGNEGDGLRLALRLGARIRGMSEAWWTAAVGVPGETRDGRPMTRNIVRELAYPGSILVNSAGHRFVDEASSYNDLGKAFLRFDQQNHTFPNARAWLITDDAFRRRYPIAGVAAGAPAPDWFITDHDLAGLGEQAGIDPETLTATVSSFNTHALNGDDPHFGRGFNRHDQYNGDVGHKPNPCLGPLTTPPYYAVPVTLGINGTKGGIVTDALGRALRTTGEPIPGLFACGNVAASLMGPGYAGSGASLGPSLTTAMVAGKQAATPDTITSR